MDVIYASDLEQPSSNDSYEVEDVESSSLLYERHGQWTCMRSTPLDLITRSKQLSEGDSEVHLEFAMIENRPRWLICKYWDAHTAWQRCYLELYLLGSSAHLRSFQGVFVPQLVGVYATSTGHICTAMEPPHNTLKGWTEVDPKSTPVHVKQKIIQAYDEIHASGVLHGDVQLRHIVITDDEDVCIVDWKSARSLIAMPSIGLHQCNPADLDAELQHVKRLLECDDAAAREPAQAEPAASPATTTHHETRSRASASPLSARSARSQSSGSIPKSEDRRVARHFEIPLLPLDLSGDRARSRSPGAPLIIPILSTAVVPPFRVHSPTPPSATSETAPFFTNPFAPSSPHYPPIEGPPQSPQQPSPPPTPPTRRQKTSRLQVRLAKIDRQIAQLQRERREVIEGLRHLEKQRSLAASLGKRRSHHDNPTATPKTSLALSDISSAPGGSPSRQRSEERPLPILEPPFDPIADRSLLHLELPSSSRRKRKAHESEENAEEASPRSKRLRIRESSAELLLEEDTDPSQGLQLELEPDAASFEALFEPHVESGPSSPK